MNCDIEIYQTVDADADRDGPGSNRGRTHGSLGVHSFLDNANLLARRAVELRGSHTLHVVHTPVCMHALNALAEGMCMH